jgi:hypothetical protein
MVSDKEAAVTTRTQYMTNNKHSVRHPLPMMTLDDLQLCDGEVPQLSSDIFNPITADIDYLDCDRLLDDNKGEWKPAGNHSNWNACGAVACLEALEPNNFLGLASAWTGTLLSKGLLYLRVVDDKYFVSLGFHGWAALAWEMVRHVESTKVYFSLHTVPSLQWLVSTRLSADPVSVSGQEDFLGIPFAVRAALSFLNSHCVGLFLMAMWISYFCVSSL